MKAGSVEQGGRFETSVFGAVRRYWIMVLMIALLTSALAVAYTLVVQEVYRASATVTVPQTSQSSDQASDQYLDSQVLLLQSQEVADRAVRIANAELKARALSPADFRGDDQALEVAPPEGATDGYGSTLVRLSFTWPDARVAQVAVNALLQAFDELRVATINAEAEATVAGIEQAMADVRTQAERQDLINQRTQTLVNQQLDLARRPTIAWAALPQVPINGNSKMAGALGLMIGTVLGAGLAYARALRRRSFGDRFDPAAIYYAPLIAEIPALSARRKRSSADTARDSLPLAADPQSAVSETFRFAAGYFERILTAHGNRLAVAFVPTDSSGARSSVVANLALAVAECGTPVLAVDADYTNSRLTSLLLPGSPPTEGFAQVLAGQRSVYECVQSSSLNPRLSVLPSGPAETVRTTGAAYSKAVEEIIGKAKAAFDLVLIDSPGLLSVADCTQLVVNSDAAVIVIGSEERVQDHVTMAERLDLVKANVLGYIYQRERRGLRHRRPHGAAASTTRQIEWSDVPSWS